ncbi:glycoside hydrolase family 3 protein [Streptomyces sp. SCUT-3]|uniref:glycoside hydrolase family 3 protein n=1 Tax=Streptomyces sp. SCUT-3 TaxID=2684469 RepID=UPI0015FDFC4F|nr:glycoside hydrolase family 3 protein [Streptomyces sp. SCUT-3]QMV21811.1 glycoside hydrolase family 3 protein [Streptomyces sp. SCUT-3]
MTTTAPVDTLTRDALTVLQPGFHGTTAPDWLLRRIGEGLGAVALFARNIDRPEQLAALTARLRAEQPELIVAADEEGGDVTRLEAGTGSSFPGNLALGAVDDPHLTRAVARELGRMLAACGVTLDWAPSADVNSDPRNPVIGVRSFGSDPQLVARHTAAWVEGLQAAGVAACAKHFPGHGDTSVDSHHALPSVLADPETLRSRELVPFAAAVAAGAKAVMSAHILVPALDPGRPATLSPAVLHDLLRRPVAEGGLGHDGLIVTDGMEMKAVSATWGIERGTVLALAAGADAICVGGGLADEATVLRLRDAVVRAVRTGELAEERLADAAARVRDLGAWSAAQAAAQAAAHPGDGAEEGDGEGIGLAAARRALRITAARPFEPVRSAPYVLALTPVTNIAVGDGTPWGVAAELDRLLPGTEVRRVGAEEAEPEALPGLMAQVLPAASGRRTVAVVRDLHRHRWMARTVAALLRERPDTIVVEMGVPRAAPAGALHIATHGAARVCGRAAAEVITGRTGQPHGGEGEPR